MKYTDDVFMGKTFGRLTANGPIEVKHKPNGKRERMVWCDCECGGRKLVNIIKLVKGEVSSCGCLAKENHQRLGNGRRDGSIKSSGNSKHYGKGTRLYSIWRNMNSRCKYPSCDNYKYYGGKGIKVCWDWNVDNPEGFRNFRVFAYINGYEDDKDIDRLDNSKDYCPENCRFVSHKFNTNNQSNNIRITYGGETFTATQWSELLHVPAYSIMTRFHNGWSEYDILNTPQLQEGSSLAQYKRHNPVKKPILFVDKDVYNRIVTERDSYTTGNGYTYIPR